MIYKIINGEKVLIADVGADWAAGPGQPGFIKNKPQLTDEGGIEVNWSTLEGKPTEFKPEAHNHLIADVTDHGTHLELGTDAETAAAGNHIHSLSEIENVPTVERIKEVLEIAPPDWEAKPGEPGHILRKPDIGDQVIELHQKQSDWHQTDEEAVDFIKNKPAWVGGGDMSEEELERIQGNYRLAQVENRGTWFAATNILYITRIEFLTYLTHLRTTTSALSNNAIFGNIPVGFRPPNQVRVTAAWQTQNSAGSGVVEIEPNGDMRYTGIVPNREGLVSFATIWICTEPLSPAPILPTSIPVVI